MATKNPSHPEAVAFAEAAARIRRLLASEDVGFIASAMSHWHALGVDAWVGSLRAAGDRRKGVVLLLPHTRDGLVTAAKDLPLCRQDGDVEIIPVDRIVVGGGRGGLAAMIRVGLRLIRLWLTRPGRPSRRRRDVLWLASAKDAAAAVFTLAEIASCPRVKGREVRLVVFDEGLGTYTSQADWRYARRLDRSAKGRIVSHGWLDRLLYGTWQWVQARIAAGYRMEGRRVFLQDEATGLLAPNTPVVADYQRAMRVGAGEIDLRRRDRPIALIVPQPWSEYEQVSLADEVGLTARAVEVLVEGGWDVRLKPHPRETAGKYDAVMAPSPERVEVLAGDCAVERIFGSMRAGDVVVGLNSTSLLIASLVYGLETYTIGRDLIRRAKTGEWFQAGHRVFERLAGDSVAEFGRRFGID